MNKKKIITVISILLAAGFLGTSLISFFVSRYSLVDLIKTNELPLTSDNIYSEIQRDLLQPIFISSLMANDTFLKDWVINGEQDIGKITKYLKEIKDKYNAFTTFYVSDKTLIYYYANGILKKVSPAEERDIWYFRVRKMKENYEVNVDPDMANKDAMTIFINYKVYDYQGNFIGATGVGLNVFAVKRLIESYQKRFNCNIFFANKNGEIVLYGAGFKFQGNNIKDITGLKKIKDRLLSEEIKNFSYFKNGNIIHLYTRYIPEFKWHLFVEQTENNAVRGILYTLLINLLICLVITGIVLFITNISLTAYQNKLEKMAVTDNLTGAYNRQILDVSLNLSMKEFNRNKKPFSLILFDIDHFKDINDEFGHLAGDDVLCHITKIINLIIRDTDILFRWGGEEFMILLNDCSGNNTMAIAEKIRNEIKDKKLILNNKEISCTVSIGATEVKPDDRIADIILRADNALYKAKQKGRDNTVLG